MWEGIPQFAVITGENGSGKSSLLQGIQNRKFFVNQDGQLYAILEFLDEFKLHGHGYNSSYSDQVQQSERELLDKHRQSRKDTSNVKFLEMKNNAKQYSHLSSIIEKLSWEDFIKKDFSTFTKQEIDFIKYWRQQLDLSIYYKHFERNQMNEESFYFSTQEEIKDWMSQLKDKNYSSRKTIFDEGELLSMFGNYFIKEINARAEIEDSETDLNIADRDQRVIDQIGENPLKKINQLLKQAYSKYRLELEMDTNFRPKLVCKNQERISIPLNEISTGEQIILSLFMWQYDKTPLHSMVFLLDEPDAHLNPKMAKMLINVLKNIIVGEFGCQVIMTTHSLSTVAQCADEDLFYMKDGRISPSTRDESIRRLTQGVMTFEQALDQLKVIEHSNKPLLIVEGKTEKILFEKYWEKYKQDQGDIPFEIIDGGGADNLPQFCNCFNIMGIQRKRVFLFDYDQKGIKNYKEILKKQSEKIGCLYVKDMETMSEEEKQAKTLTIEKLFPFHLVKKYFENELRKIPLSDFVKDLKEADQERFASLYPRNKAYLYRITDSKQSKTKFAEEILDNCEEEVLENFKALLNKIMDFFDSRDSSIED